MAILLVAKNKNFKIFASEGKAMVSVFWDTEGTLLVLFLEKCHN